MKFVDWLLGRTDKNAVVARQARGFQAARPDNLAAGFSVFRRSMAEDIRWELRGLIAHSRTLSQNNDHLKYYLNLVRRNVIGPQGIRLQNRAMINAKKFDENANEIIEAAWVEWGKKQHCALDGQMSWKSAEAVGIRMTARDGTVLVRQYRGQQFGKFGFQIQMLPIDFLDYDLNVEQPSGAVVRMGVEFDKDGRRVAYHLFDRPPSEYSGGRARQRVRVLADNMLCLHRPEDAGQVLGVPWSYTALRRLNMTKGYEEAAITAARAGASQMGFYKPPEDDASVDPDLIKDKETSIGGHLLTNLEPGIQQTLPPGWDYVENNPKYPTGDFKPFMDKVIQGAAVGLDVSYPTLSGDLSGTNFSSMRAGKGEERDEWRMIQGWFAEEFHEQIFMNWLPMALLTQAVPLPISKLASFAKPTWRGRGWAYVSPGEEANANQREMAAGLRSPQQIVAERGDDLQDVFRELAQAKAMAKELGVVFDPRPPGHENSGQQPAAEPTTAAD